jgi:hypothetical protein
MKMIYLLRYDCVHDENDFVQDEDALFARYDYMHDDDLFVKILYT